MDLLTTCCNTGRGTVRAPRKFWPPKTAGIRSYQTVLKVVNSRYISKHTNLNIWTAIVKCIVCAVCGTAVGTLQNVGAENAKKDIGPKTVQNCWKKPTDDELRGMCRKLSVVTRVAVKHWNGLVSRWECLMILLTRVAVKHWNGLVSRWECLMILLTRVAVKHWNGLVSRWECLMIGG